MIFNISSVRSLIYHYYLLFLSKTILKSSIRELKLGGNFSEEEYLKANPDINNFNVDPAVHYILYGKAQNRPIESQAGEKIKDQENESFFLASNFQKSYLPVGTNPEYEEERPEKFEDPAVRLIAFYLPQYHPFEENDRFWGKGFTEWTNVTKAVPLYDGHYQPRLPGEMGFYDTRIKDVLKRQIELAKQSGIYGFCLHHYFFKGKAVMRVPYHQIMNNKDLDMPFCLHWANESWTAKFDGYGNKGGILLKQQHSPEDDFAFFKDIEPALNDSRYIRIDGKPLILIYRAGLFPNLKETAERWRECALKSKIGDLFLAMVQTGFDGKMDPRPFGFDASVEFPPHLVRNVSVKDELKLYYPEFKGYVCSYPEVVNGAVEASPPEYTYFRGIFPYWDNTPRIEDAVIYHGSTPALYKRWLEHIGKYTIDHLLPSQRFVFLNAWNEWAEGAYLEPDRKYGYAYLNATSKALKTINEYHPK